MNHSARKKTHLALGLAVAATASWILLLNGCNSTSPSSDTPPAALMTKGQASFTNSCSGCHGLDAKGTQDVTPPLYNSDFFMADRHRIIRILLTGTGDTSSNPLLYPNPITVNGTSYSGQMPRGGNIAYSDSDIAGVLTYVRSTFNGHNDYIQVSEVASVRDSLKTACRALNAAHPTYNPPPCDSTLLDPDNH